MESKEMINKTFDNYLEGVQIDKGLKALADIKVLIEAFYDNIGYISDIEINEFIQEIERLCKYRNKFLSQIKRLIKKYYEIIGRDFEDGIGDRPDNKLLIRKIEDIIYKAEIPANYIVISRLKS